MLQKASFLALLLILTTVATGLESSSRDIEQSGARVALLNGISKLTDSLNESKLEDQQKYSLLSRILDSFRFRLMNGRINEKSPRELVNNLVAKLHEASSENLGNGFEETLEQMRSEATQMWDNLEFSVSESRSSDSCTPTVAPTAPEVALEELTKRCTKGGDVLGVLGCVGAATLYCHKIFPQRSYSELVGLVTDRKGNALSIACIDRGGLVLTADNRLFTQHCRHICDSWGSDRVCELHYGSEYGGIYADRVTLKTMGEEFEHFFMAGCFPVLKRLPVEYSKLQTTDRDCRPGDSIRNYGCLRAASSYCRDHFNYTGGVIQHAESHSTAIVACYNAFYTGDVQISRDADFLKAKNSLMKICSLEFEIDKGKILSATPESLHMGHYDNRKSTVELRDTFKVSTTVASENEFHHSHSLSIGIQASFRTQIPFIVEKKLTLSFSYTATVSLTEKNSKSSTYEHTSDVIVPPGKGVIKKAIITRTKMEVPWKAVGLNGLGKRVEVSGIWFGVDVSNIDVQQDDL